MAKPIMVVGMMLLGTMCRAAEPGSEHLAAKAEWERKLSGIHPGLAMPSVHHILKKMGKRRRQWFERGKERKPHDLYWLEKNGSWRLHVAYTVDWAVESFEVFRPSFADVLDRIPKGRYPYLKLIHESPGFRGASFDPARLIRAVNGLHPLGKDGALEAMSAYLRLSRDPTVSYKYDLGGQRIFPVLRLLFVRKDGDPMAPVTDTQTGKLRPGKPRGGDWPLYPFALVDDIPFRVAVLSFRSGPSRNPAAYVEYARKRCVLRDRPLVPRGSPMSAADHLVSSARWRRMCPHAEQAEPILQQACTAIRHLFEPRGSSRIFMLDWKESARAARALSARWDAKAQAFVSAPRSG